MLQCSAVQGACVCDCRELINHEAEQQNQPLVSVNLSDCISLCAEEQNQLRSKSVIFSKLKDAACVCQFKLLVEILSMLDVYLCQ